MQAGAWISTFLWVGVFVVGFLSMHRAGKLPFIQSGGTAGGNATGGNTAPPKMETPPNNPDDLPKY